MSLKASRLTLGSFVTTPMSRGKSTTCMLQVGVFLRFGKNCSITMSYVVLYHRRCLNSKVKFSSDDLVIKTKIGGSSSEDVDEIFPLNQSEVVDFTLASNNRLVIATNNAHMRVYHFDSGYMTVAHSPSGHTDAVLAVAALNPLLDKVPETTEDHFVSCGKDQSVCLWKFKGNAVQLVGKGTIFQYFCK